MAQTDVSEMAGYNVPLIETNQPGSNPARVSEASLFRPLSAELIENIRWFCRLRWMVASVLVIFGILAFFPGIYRALHLKLAPDWLLTAGVLVILGNLTFVGFSRKARRGHGTQAARINLWTQIVFDLFVLTAVVHFIGSLGTFAPFGYLFHIVLACIFFSRTESFMVTLLAGVMYATCVGLEGLSVLASTSVFSGPLVPRGDMGTLEIMLQICSVVGIWFIVWYLAAKLSAMVRGRRQELLATNRLLVKANAERVRHMLHTAHELKAPFAAIYANIQLLERGSLGEIPEKAVAVLRQVGVRCKGLSQEIKEMLQLANLESTVQDIPPLTEMDMKEVITSCMERIGPTMEVRGITIEQDLESVRVMAFADHMVMLFENLLANAVTYSHKGGTVRVKCSAGPAGNAVVIIEDEGIGIEKAKLPKIFDAYYRTNEAVRHNHASTGLGLTIVQHVARTSGIGVSVESGVNLGTRFTLNVPSFPLENEIYG